MPRPTRAAARLAAATLLTTFAAAAQTTWIVDETGGGNFTDLPGALAVARSGDTVLVRPGTYTPGSTSAGIAVVGTNATLRDTPAFRVTNLPAGDRFVLSGFRADTGSFENFSVELENNAGLVHLQDLDAAPILFFVATLGTGVRIRNCASVSMNACAFAGAVALDVDASRVVATDTVLRGIPYDFPNGPTPGLRIAGGPAASVTLAQCDVRGGDGFNGMGLPPPEPGVRMTSAGSELTICGTSSSVLGGIDTRPFGGMTPALGIASNSGTVRTDLRVTNAISKLGTSTFVDLPLACVTSGGVPPGGTMQARYDVPAGLVTALAASLPAPASPSVFGDLWLDTGSAITLYVGVGAPAAPLPLPLGPLFVAGEGVAFQGLVLFPRGAELSTPAVATVR